MIDYYIILVILLSLKHKNLLIYSNHLLYFSVELFFDVTELFCCLRT